MSSWRKRGSGFEFKVSNRKLLGPNGRSRTFDTKEEGQRWADYMEHLLRQGIVHDDLQGGGTSSVKRKVTINELADEYVRTVSISRMDEQVLPRALKEIGETDKDDITYDWAESWVADMKRTKNRAPGTIRSYVGATSRLLNWSYRKQYIVENPLAHLPLKYSQYTEEDEVAVRDIGGERKDEHARETRLEPEWEETIRKVLNGEHKPEDKQRSLELPYKEEKQLIFELALETGMRLSEIYTIEYQQIDLPKRTVFLEKTKNGRKRQVPLSSVALESLKTFLSARKFKRGEQIFTEWREELKERAPKTDKQLKQCRERVTSRLSKFFSRVFDHAGCPEFRYHDLRHELTSRLYERTTMTDLEIASITGHTDMKMLQRYANLRAATTVEKMW